MLGWGPRRASEYVQVFDPVTCSWSVFHKTLNVGRAAFGLHTTGRKLVLTGGFAVVEGVEQELDTTEAIDVDEINEVEEISKLPSPRGGCQSLKTAGDVAVVIGGEAPKAKVVKSDSLHLEVGEWRRGKMPELATARTAFAACVGKVWPTEYHTARIFTTFDF